MSVEGTIKYQQLHNSLTLKTYRYAYIDIICWQRMRTVSTICGYTLRGDLGAVVDRGLVSDYIRLCETAHFLRDVTSRNLTITAFILL